LIAVLQPLDSIRKTAYDYLAFIYKMGMVLCLTDNS
jgi:hypothetical protein